MFLNRWAAAVQKHHSIGLCEVNKMKQNGEVASVGVIYTYPEPVRLLEGNEIWLARRRL